MRVRGATRTRESFLGSIIDPFLRRQDEETATLESVLRRTKEIKSKLEETDLFSQVQVIIDRNRDALARPDDVDVVFLMKERGRYFLNTSTQVGNNEGGAVSLSVLLSGLEASCPIGSLPRSGVFASCGGVDAHVRRLLPTLLLNSGTHNMMNCLVWHCDKCPRRYAQSCTPWERSPIYCLPCSNCRASCSYPALCGVAFAIYYSILTFIVLECNMSRS